MKGNLTIKVFLLPALIQLADMSYAEPLAQKKEQQGVKPAWEISEACNPIVKVDAYEEKRFQVLKKLAIEHGFEIIMLAEENTPITMEKRQTLSKVVESITREMSVVLKYRKIDGCERLVAVSILETSKVGAGGVYSDRGSNDRIKQFRPGMEEENTFKHYRRDSETPKFDEIDEESELEEGLSETDPEQESGYYDDIPQDATADTSYSEKANWKYGGESEQDIRPFVEDVIDGDRLPNLDVMTEEQREEFERVKQEILEERGRLEED